MEVEKRKRKRKMVIRDHVDDDEEKRDRFKKLKNEEAHAGGGAAAAAPSEEEVEEFFAILRRMKEVVKYFDERGRPGRVALEQAEITAVDDGDIAGDDIKKEEDVAVAINYNEILDLNAAAPEADESGGA